MRAYSRVSEEALRARDSLILWAADGLVSKSQFECMEQDCSSKLRRTNVFLRIVCFLFTSLSLGAAVGLFFVVFPGWTQQATGIILLVCAGLSYVAAELGVSRGKLYRHGIEEAAAVCAVVCTCLGVGLVLVQMPEYAALTAGTGALASLWIWHRFGLVYGFPAAMICLAWMPQHWKPALWAYHLAVTVIYAAGLTAILFVRRRPRDRTVNDPLEVAEGFLWLGLYIGMNVQLFSNNPFTYSVQRWHFQKEFPEGFYWASWLWTLCLPVAIIARGIVRKDRFTIGAGVLSAVLTLITTKSYFGLEPQSWDPMVLGAVLIGGALGLRRWLDAGPGGVRQGFTAHRLSGKGEAYQNAVSLAAGLGSSETTRAIAETHQPPVRFGGGDSGGAGASADF